MRRWPVTLVLFVQIVLLALTTPMLLVVSWLSAHAPWPLALWSLAYVFVIWLTARFATGRCVCVPSPGVASLLLAAGVTFSVSLGLAAFVGPLKLRSIGDVLVYIAPALAALAGHWLPVMLKGR